MFEAGRHPAPSLPVAMTHHNHATCQALPRRRWSGSLAAVQCPAEWMKQRRQPSVGGYCTSPGEMGRGGGLVRKENLPGPYRHSTEPLIPPMTYKALIVFGFPVLLSDLMAHSFLISLCSLAAHARPTLIFSCTCGSKLCLGHHLIQ